MFRFLPLLVAALACGCATAPDPTRIERDELAPTGVLRVAVFIGNPAIGRTDPVRGDPAGTIAVLGRELALHAGLPVRLVEYAAEARLVEDAGKGAWDVAALACEPAHAGVLEYSPPYLVVAEHGRPDAGVCLVVPGGRSAARSYVAGFVLRAKSQGVVARAIADAGLSGVSVAQ